MKVSRPSFIPFWGKTTIEKHVPLSLVIDVIIEQGTDASSNMLNDRIIRCKYIFFPHLLLVCTHVFPYSIISVYGQK